MNALIETVPTPDGPFTLVADEQGRVLGSGWTDQDRAVLERIHPALRPDQPERGQTDAAQAVRAYYDGDLDAPLRVQVHQRGTAFQHEGWRALRGIEPGRPLTYSEFAAVLGRPSSVRAVASICARNAPALFVPCHRVLRADGSMGGFAWGTAVKRALLDRESSAGAQHSPVVG